MSRSDRNWEIAWVAWCLLCVVGMLADPSMQTVYFHFIWISLAMISGFHLWGVKKAAIAVLCIAPVTTFALLAPSGPAASSDRKSTRLNSSHIQKSRMPSSA